VNKQWQEITVDEIESQTDVAAAETTADKISAGYLRHGQEIWRAKRQLQAMEDQLHHFHYLFCAAKAKYLELKLGNKPSG
jgi:hypothetical protein